MSRSLWGFNHTHQGDAGCFSFGTKKRKFSHAFAHVGLRVELSLPRQYQIGMADMVIQPGKTGKYFKARPQFCASHGHEAETEPAGRAGAGCFGIGMEDRSEAAQAFFREWKIGRTQSFLRSVNS